MIEDKGLRAGWKGMVFYHRKLMTIPPWIDPKCVGIFEEGLAEMKEAIRRSGNMRKHPYMFAFCGDKRALGEPMKLRQIKRAFDRAARKAGLLGKEGIHLHGFRHHYVWFLRNILGFERTDIKITMGHSSEKSQDDYGGRLKSIFDRVTQKQEARNAT